MRIIVGLGNPGKEYEATRHNIGFWVVDQLCDKGGGKFKKGRYPALEVQVEIEGVKILLVKPETFMNVSGEAVVGALHYYKVKPEGILVIHDDLDLPLGKIKWGEGGSSGGHHGLDSIIGTLGTPHFTRLRLGIGRPPHSGEGADYVLSRFGKEERKIAEKEVEEGAESVLFFMKNGLAATMNTFNRKQR